MEHFVRIVFERQEGLNESLDESIFPGNELLETEQGAHMFQIPLARQLSEEESDEYANRLANYMFEQGYDDFDIEISSDIDDLIDEETYDGDDFFEEYGVMWFNEDDDDLDEANELNTGNYDVYKQTDDLSIIISKNKDHAAITNKRGTIKWIGGEEDGEWEFTNIKGRYGVFYVDNLDDILKMDPEDLIESQDNEIDEAEYQGRKVKLGKPMRGDVKKFKVYVRDPKTKNVKKVNFGDPNMKIKKSNPARRRSFRARHNCDNPGPRTKARYWSCRKW
jgi:hypothetical protein